MTDDADSQRATANQRWIGVVPSHWQVVQLKLVARLESGHTPSRQVPEYWENCTIPWFSLADVWQLREEGRKYVYETAERVSELGIANSSARILPAGTVMLSRTASVGFTGIMGREMATTQDFANWVCSPRLKPDYLWNCLQAMRTEFERLRFGSTHQTIYMPDVAQFKVPLPPLSEQERIANFLDEQTARIDALIAEKERLLVAVKEFAHAEISRLLSTGVRPAIHSQTGNAFVPIAPTGWRVAALKRALHGLEQGWSPQCESRPAEPGEWGVMKVGCVNGTVFDPSENKALPPEVEPDMSCVLKAGDVLVSRANTRELVGMAALVEDDYANLLLCDKLYRLKLDPGWIRPDFAVLALRGEASRRQIELGASGASASMQNISQDVLRELVVAFPPLDEQVEVVEHARRVRGSTSALGEHVLQHIDRLREYRSSLISAAVTGQLDLSAYRLPAAEELVAT